MRELKELTCKNCGGRINPVTMRCEYCGTQYEERMDRIVFVSDRQAEVLRAAVLINDEMIHLMGEETVSKYAIDEIALKLALGQFFLVQLSLIFLYLFRIRRQIPFEIFSYPYVFF